MTLECLTKIGSYTGQSAEWLIKSFHYFENDNSIALVLTFPPKYNFLPISFAFITAQNEVWVCYNYDPKTNLISI